MSENCHVDPVVKQVAPEAFKNARTIFLAVSGMGCPNCALRVQNSLVRLDGVLEARVDHTQSLAQVVFNPATVSATEMVQAVANTGVGTRHIYRAQVIQ